MYASTLEALVARVHPSIRRVRVSQRAGTQDVLTVTIEAPAAEEDAIRSALARAEPSFRPGDFSLAYEFIHPAP